MRKTTDRTASTSTPSATAGLRPWASVAAEYTARTGEPMSRSTATNVGKVAERKIFTALMRDPDVAALAGQQLRDIALGRIGTRREGQRSDRQDGRGRSDRPGGAGIGGGGMKSPNRVDP